MPTDVTRLLGEVASGRPRAADELLVLVYNELRRLAAAQIARLRPGQTLQPTALVHEAYLKLVGDADPGWNSRGHFLAAAAQAMREIIIDQIRRKSAIKRGGGQAHHALDEAVTVLSPDMNPEEAMGIDAAIGRLQADHPRKAQVVVMRYFGGLGEDEIAAALGVTPRTVERDWRFARAYLHALLSEGPA